MYWLKIEQSFINNFVYVEVTQPLSKIVTSRNRLQVVNDVLFLLLYIALRCVASSVHAPLL